MAEKEFEPGDPYEFVASAAPAPPGVDAQAAMARVFVEEFALMGMSPERILRLFRSPRFAGTNAIWRARGDDFVRDIIENVFGGPGCGESAGGGARSRPAADPVASPSSRGPIPGQAERGT